MSQFHVPDIHCDGCIRALTAVARSLDSNATVEADLETKLVTVRTEAADAAVMAAFEDAGFSVAPG